MEYLRIVRKSMHYFVQVKGMFWWVNLEGQPPTGFSTEAAAYEFLKELKQAIKDTADGTVYFEIVD